MLVPLVPLRIGSSGSWSVFFVSTFWPTSTEPFPRSVSKTRGLALTLVWFRMRRQFSSTQIGGKTSKLIIHPKILSTSWRDKPTKSLEKVYMQSVEFTGKDAASKLGKLQEWIRQQPPDKSYPNKVTGPMDVSVATLVTAFNCIGL